MKPHEKCENYFYLWQRIERLFLLHTKRLSSGCARRQPNNPSSKQFFSCAVRHRRWKENALSGEIKDWLNRLLLKDFLFMTLWAKKKAFIVPLYDTLSNIPDLRRRTLGSALVFKDETFSFSDIILKKFSFNTSYDLFPFAVSCRKDCLPARI